MLLNLGPDLEMDHLITKVRGLVYNQGIAVQGWVVFGKLIIHLARNWDWCSKYGTRNGIME